MSNNMRNVATNGKSVTENASEQQQRNVRGNNVRKFNATNNTNRNNNNTATV